MKPAELFAAAAVIVTATFGISHYLAPKFDDTSTSETVKNPAHLPSNTSPQAANKTQPVAANAAMLRLEDDGHYWASADVDGTHVRFMVDTGASTVALTYADARRIGLDPDALDYSWRIRTAGGEVFGASVQLSTVRIGRVEVHDVEAMVLRDGLTQSLLGMTFLSQLDSYEFRRANLILRQ